MPLHPELQQLLQQVQAMGLPSFSSMTPAEARQRMGMSAGMLGNARPSGLRIHDEQLAGPGGPLTVRVFTPEPVPEPSSSPAAEAPRPGVVFLHGGGWVIGSVADYEPDCARLAARTGAVVLSVEYRLAPEHPFPAAVDDAVAAMRWAHANAARLGIDPARLAVAGDSAGGNLAAVVAQELRGRPEAPCLQLLIYPATDAHTEIPEKRQPIPGMLQPADLDWFEGHYLRSDADRRDPRLSPNLAEDLSGLPPAIVALAEFDPLYTEGLAYARRLQAAGVTVEIMPFPGLIHGFLAFAALLPSCGTAEVELHARVRTALGGA